MKAIVAFVLLSFLPATAQDVEYKTLALRDGRYIEIVGDYKVIGETLHFTMASGNEMVTLPLAKADLNKSERLNHRLGDTPNTKNGSGPLGNSRLPRDIVVILNDGSSLRTKGTYGLFGETIQFTLPNGKVMTLPLEKVDLDATRRRNPGFKDTRHWDRRPDSEQPVLEEESEPDLTTLPNSKEELDIII